jgi:hypothetical protein
VGVSAAIIFVAIVTASAAGTCWLVRRPAESTRDRLIREAHERAEAARDLDALQLLDLEAHLKAYGATVADLYEPVPPADHDHTTKGD